MSFHGKEFRVPPGRKIKLTEWPTRIKPVYASDKEYKKLLREDNKRLGALQKLLYASAQKAVLLIFQGMDAAGKDSSIRHVLAGVDPHGCQVFSFKQPSAEEQKHDFLWRTACRLPERGKIGIFNRSYYEEVVVVRVHPEFLAAQGLHPRKREMESFWKDRYRSIVDAENHLHRNGTRVIKFFLHLSKEEQRKRLLARIDEPSKNWKFNLGDIAERKLWNRYMQAYQSCLDATSTDAAPWHVIPADDKLNARLIISRVIIEALADLKMKYPGVSGERHAELREIRKSLAG